MNETNRYYVRHVRQSLDDFNKDIHRFTYILDGVKRKASIVGNVSVFFENENDIPDTVKYNVQEKIYSLMNKYEKRWSVPNGAQEIADSYCAEEFHQ